MVSIQVIERETVRAIRGEFELRAARTLLNETGSHSSV
jgi:hypothetical protein